MKEIRGGSRKALYLMMRGIWRGTIRLGVDFVERSPARPEERGEGQEVREPQQKGKR